MITEIENALVDRLTRGLGQLANTVKSYGGELDDESLGTGRLPMVLVTFGGARIEQMTVRGNAFRTTAKFVVIVAVRSLRSNQAARQGGVDKREIGANQLIYAVRRLLDAQRLGGLVKPLKPLAIRTLFNSAQFRTEKVTAYAIEYEAVFDDIAPLEDGLYPEKHKTRQVLILCLPIMRPNSLRRRQPSSRWTANCMTRTTMPRSALV